MKINKKVACSNKNQDSSDLNKDTNFNSNNFEMDEKKHITIHSNSFIDHRQTLEEKKIKKNHLQVPIQKSIMTVSQKYNPFIANFSQLMFNYEVKRQDFDEYGEVLEYYLAYFLYLQ
ncbi:MAG: hypothetical protein MHPSP_001567 [Paramarteilia canceri]